MGIDSKSNKSHGTYGTLHLLPEFADLRVPAAEFMLGELHAGVEPKNAGGAAGPAESQVWQDVRETRAYWREQFRKK